MIRSYKTKDIFKNHGGSRLNIPTCNIIECEEKYSSSIPQQENDYYYIIIIYRSDENKSHNTTKNQAINLGVQSFKSKKLSLKSEKLEEISKNTEFKAKKISLISNSSNNCQLNNTGSI